MLNDLLLLKVKNNDVNALLNGVDHHERPLVAVVLPKDERLCHDMAGGLVEVPKAAFLDSQLLLFITEVYLVLLQDLFGAAEMALRRVKKCGLAFLPPLRDNWV